MAKGTRFPEETKRDIAERYSNGEDAAELSERFGVSQYTVKDYASKYGKGRKRGVKRKVTVQSVRQPKENSRVSDAEKQALREEIQRLRELLLDEILRNR